MQNMRRSATILLVLIASTPIFAQPDGRSAESYPEHPDSKQHDGVPVGAIYDGQFSQSKVYLGTERDYWVYVPEQYDGSKPAALMVFQDGRNYVNRKHGFRIPNVFDNLIAAGEIPVTIAVFVNPGVVPATDDSAPSRFNRSFEYDSVDDRYARFLIDELLPMVCKKHDLKITDDR